MAEPITLAQAEWLVANLAAAADAQITTSAETLVEAMRGLAEDLVARGMAPDHVSKTLAGRIPQDSLLFAVLVRKHFRDGLGDILGYIAQ